MNFSSYDDNINKNMDKLLESFNNKLNVIEVQNVYIYFFYVVNQSCDMYKRDIVALNNGILLKETLMTEIVKNRNESGRRFNVSGIYNYNFNKTDLKEFLNNGTTMEEYKTVDNVKFENSIDFFEHHNSIFVFMTNEKNKNTKKTNLSSRSKTLKAN
jgi:hypothetical protein